MPILGIVASQISGHLDTFTSTGSYDAIASLNTNGGTEVSFVGIPAGYKHLQLRIYWNAGTTAADLQMKLNASAPTQAHMLYGNGSTAANASSDYDSNGWYIDIGNFNNSYPNYPTSAIVDIFDYSDSNKYKTVRALSGTEYNSGDTKGRVGLKSAFWSTTSPVTSITFRQSGGSYGSATNFALYGVRG
jgi:hypothetical protein